MAIVFIAWTYPAIEVNSGATLAMRPEKRQEGKDNPEYS